MGTTNLSKPTCFGFYQATAADQICTHLKTHKCFKKIWSLDAIWFENDFNTTT
jgi:hypothetical protein